MLRYEDERSLACRLQTTVPLPILPVTVLSKGHKNFSVKGLLPCVQKICFLWTVNVNMANVVPC